MDLKKTWQEYNKKRGGSFLVFLLRIVLSIFSYVFLLAYYLRVLLYKLKFVKSKKLESKVISVGNITLGGTGKTPLVIYLGEGLKERGEDFAILTRGYKRENKEMMEIKNKRFCWKKVGDEPYMLSARLPDVSIFVNKNRLVAGKKALAEYNVRTLILDDGFQYWNLKRDVNVLMIDCLNPFGGGKIFPAGFLREPLSALKRADIFVLNKADQATNVEEIKRVLNRYNSEALKVESLYLLDSIRCLEDYSFVNPGALRGKSVTAFSGIANSSSFGKTLDQLAVKILMHFEFSDHFPYGEKDILEVEKDSLRLGAQAILTTEKDAVRIPEMDCLRIPLYLVRIKLQITKGEKDFWKTIGLS